jgi:hypothetical protein
VQTNHLSMHRGEKYGSTCNVAQRSCQVFQLGIYIYFGAKPHHDRAHRPVICACSGNSLPNT